MPPETKAVMEAIPGTEGAVCLLRSPNGLHDLRLRTPAASATIRLQGAQLLEYASAACRQPLLWVSEAAIHRPGHALRGGIPLCWPWFGAGRGAASAVQHGYARTAQWALCAAQRDGDEVALTLRMRQPEGLPFPLLPAEATLRIEVGARLSLELRTRNQGTQAIVITEALHTYLLVGDVRQVRLAGLDGASFVDKLDGMRQGVQRGEVRCDRAIDRMFLSTTSECLLDDPVLSRRILLRKSGSRSTVVWNPWLEGAGRMADMRGAGWQRMLCVEAGNVDRDRIVVEPDAEHVLRASYEVEEY